MGLAVSKEKKFENVVNLIDLGRRSMNDLEFDIHILGSRTPYVTLIHYPKYNISPSNSLQDMMQNHWTIKYRSLTYI